MKPNPQPNETVDEQRAKALAAPPEAEGYLNSQRPFVASARTHPV